MILGPLQQTKHGRFGNHHTCGSWRGFGPWRPSRAHWWQQWWGQEFALQGPMNTPAKCEWTCACGITRRGKETIKQRKDAEAYRFNTAERVAPIDLSEPRFAGVVAERFRNRGAAGPICFRLCPVASCRLHQSVSKWFTSSPKPSVL